MCSVQCSSLSLIIIFLPFIVSPLRGLAWHQSRSWNDCSELNQWHRYQNYCELPPSLLITPLPNLLPILISWSTHLYSVADSLNILLFTMDSFSSLICFCTFNNAKLMAQMLLIKIATADPFSVYSQSSEGQSRWNVNYTPSIYIFRYNRESADPFAGLSF